MYVKPMQVEQLYESLLVATSADSTGAGSFEASQAQREQMMRQFMQIFGANDDEDTAVYSGTIPQALLMMNGALIKNATSGDKGSYLNAVLTNPSYKKDQDRIRALYMAALGRIPSSSEQKNMQAMMSQYPDPLSAYQDLYWALLNSNEFIVNR